MVPSLGRKRPRMSRLSYVRQHCPSVPRGNHGDARVGGDSDEGLALGVG
jgi:hypothetical protein